VIFIHSLGQPLIVRSTAREEIPRKFPHESHVFPIIVTSLDSTDNKHGVQRQVRRCRRTELSQSLSCLSDNRSSRCGCLSDNRSSRCGQCVRPIKYLPDLHFFYNFNWITRILAKSIKWFVYSFKWYLGILKVSTAHFLCDMWKYTHNTIDLCMK
jgi:hypothetical protein